MEYKLRKGIRKWASFLLRAALILVVLFLLWGSFSAGFDPQGCRIHPGVRVGGLDVGGMSPEDAWRALNTASDAVLENTVLTVQLPEETLQLSPADTKVRLQTGRAVLAAWQAGRRNQETSIPLTPYLKLDEQYIRDTLAAYASRYDTDLTPYSYRMTGTMPDLEIENQSKENICQTLELTMGLPTARLDLEDAFRKILDAYDFAFSAAETNNYTAGNFRVDILEEPKKPDLQAIYEEFYIAPVDDAIDLEACGVELGAYGYGFDREAAGKQTEAAAFGETIFIPMTFIEPEIFGEKVYFRDVLGYCETPHTKDENRNNNLRMACQSMDGLVLQPGEVFSYNDTLGPRTKERGYLRAGAYSGWDLVLSYGGGICQGSSTIYCAALYADLEIVFRRNHGYMVSYIDAGLDATVNWGGPDFQFRNNTHYPIKIAAEVSDGLVKVTILGTEERDYYVEMESEAVWGDDAIYAKSYKCKYDRETHELLSRELEARSNYMR